MKFFIIFYVGNCLGLGAQQIGTYMGDESIFYAQTKQVNQFFRRFNNEESKDGERYYPEDKNYRNLNQRRKFLEILFDGENQQLLRHKQAFIEQLCQKENPQFLDSHAGDWYAEVKAHFLHQGKEEIITLFLKLEKEKLGYKWGIYKIHYEPFRRLFESDTTKGKRFLHPMSHEIGFMNLEKAFRDLKEIQQYQTNDHEIDYLSILFYEMKKGNFIFETVSDVKFHFFQIKDWYFEVSEFVRPGYNTGWLISNLIPVKEVDKPVLKKFIFKE
ncbi:MAG: hypothetical protein NZ521_02960 [Flammeovirgaceae bacterium]|nr:hypothetical protein [Flammeovirgaceae bacterium]MDW8287075.1 hypothetical protein [Flammeovirgaceae bacterium]